MKGKLVSIQNIQNIMICAEYSELTRDEDDCIVHNELHLSKLKKHIAFYKFSTELFNDLKSKIGSTVSELYEPDIQGCDYITSVIHFSKTEIINELFEKSYDLFKSLPEKVSSLHTDEECDYGNLNIWNFGEYSLISTNVDEFYASMTNEDCDNFIFPSRSDVLNFRIGACYDDKDIYQDFTALWGFIAPYNDSNGIMNEEKETFDEFVKEDSKLKKELTEKNKNPEFIRLYSVFLHLYSEYFISEESDIDNYISMIDKAIQIDDIITSLKSGTNVHMEFINDSSKKFYDCTLNGTNVSVSYGRIGNPSNDSVLEYESEDSSIKKMKSIIISKAKKGYAIV